MIEIRLLEWDTDFFGFRVGRLEVSVSGADLSDLPARMAAQGYRLCYLLARDDQRASQSAASSGAELVDLRTTFKKELAPRTSRDLPAQEQLHACDMANLRSLALQSAEFSRFKIDPRMPPGKWVRMYERWIENSLNGTLADAVLVERVGGAVVALLTVKVQEGAGSIGLFAVDASVRGRGLGKKLLKRAEEWFQAHGCSSASVVTQGNNIAACRTYESAGYRVAEVTDVYHLWALSAA